MSATTTQSDQRAKLRKIANDSHSAMMVTRTAGDSLHGRPMANAQVEENFSSLWFATSRDSGKVDELKTDDRVFLSYNNTSGSEWATVNGRARVVNDKAKIKELWSPIWKNWFDGPDDPKLTLLEVIPETAEYWDSGSKTIAMLKFAIGAVTGKKMEDTEHGKLEGMSKR